MSATIVAIAAVVVAGCGPTYTYLTSSSSKSYLAVPHAWKVFDQKAIKKSSNTTGSFPYLAAFDAGAHPSLKDLVTPSAQPWGVIQIRDLTGDERETYSFDSITNELIQYDELSQAGQAQVVGGAQVLTSGSYRGVRQEIELQDGSKTIDAYDVGYVNNATTKSWALLVGCSSTCFTQHHAEINRLVHSWIVGKS